MFKKIIVITGLLLSPIANSATYNLVDNGTYTRDLNSNLEWLDLSFTQGLSYNSLLTELNTNSNLAGWRLASLPEFKGIFTSRGYLFSGGSIISETTSLQNFNDPFFSTIINHFGTTAVAGSQLLSRGLLDEDYAPLSFQNSQIFGDIRYNTNTKLGYTSLGKVLDNDSGSILGAYLVREASTAPIPEPDAIWLMLSGLGVMGVALKRRKNQS
jgi:hypothetical protein